MLNFTDAPTNDEVVTSWFINTTLDLDGVPFHPRENISLKSNKTEGILDTLFTRIVEKERWELIEVAIASININGKLLQEEVEDAELDALLGTVEQATPLFSKQTKSKKAPVFAYINCEISSQLITKGSALKGTIVVRQDAPRAVLSSLLKLSKDEKPNVTATVTSLLDPRVEEEYVVDLSLI